MIENDRVVTVDSLAAIEPFGWSNSIKFDAEGRIVVTVLNPVANYCNGLPRDIDGNLCITEA